MPQHKHKHQHKKSSREREAAEIRELDERAEREAPEPGSVPRMDVESFAEFAISQATLRALKEKDFKHPTRIQCAALPHALAGRDILGAAHTGSGKTLSFIIPVVERLYRAGWTPLDGAGAIIISPTRELSMQIFDVLRVVAEHHDLTAGLLVGGKDVEEEKRHIMRLNILVCTPGRLRHHVERTDGFTCDGVQIFVLDEADRCMDMGFEADLNAIIEALPPADVRQTMLFSATQTRRVKDLARLSLVDPEFIAVHSEAATSTPDHLDQHYIEVELDRKLETLYSFIKSHMRSKILVFFSSCKQVRFVFESFRHLRPGVVLMELHGRMKQQKRVSLYQDFCTRRHVVMFATDVAARGLDFPDVDWVVQVDCPEDVDSYIHRVGRTARNDSNGQALLFLAPSELAMADKLKAARVPLQFLEVNPSKLRPFTNQISGLLARDTQLKYLAEKAFVNYIKGVHVQKDKSVFNVQALPVAAFAESLGLLGTPRLRFLSRDGKGKGKGRKGAVGAVTVDADSDSDADADADAGHGAGAGAGLEADGDGGVAGDGPKTQKVRQRRKEEHRRSRIERLVTRKNQDVFSEAFRKLHEHESGAGSGGDSDSDGELLVSKRVILPSDSESDGAQGPSRESKRRRVSGTDAVETLDLMMDAERAKRRAAKEARGKRVRAAVAKRTRIAVDGESDVEVEGVASRMASGAVQMREADVLDRERERARVKEMHRDRKRKLKKARRLREEDEAQLEEFMEYDEAGSGSEGDAGGEGEGDPDPAAGRESMELAALRLISQGGL